MKLRKEFLSPGALCRIFCELMGSLNEVLRTAIPKPCRHLPSLQVPGDDCERENAVFIR